MAPVHLLSLPPEILEMILCSLKTTGQFRSAAAAAPIIGSLIRRPGKKLRKALMLAEKRERLGAKRRQRKMHLEQTLKDLKRAKEELMNLGRAMGFVED